MPANKPQHDPAPSPESQIGPLTGIFTFVGASSGVGFYLLSQRLTPTVEAMGIDGLWIDVALLVGGVMLLWTAITSKGRAPEKDAIPVEG